jgi:proteasome accessory factor B
VDLDSARLDVVTPSIDTSEPSFEQFWEATQQRRVTTFNYRATGRPETQRRLQPWGVVRSSGRWYVVGFDLDREAQRVFRLSRVVGAVKLGRKPEAYVIPEDADIRAVARDLAPQLPRREISYLARRGTAQGLRRRALQVTTAVPGPDGTTSWDRLIVELTAPDAVWEALSHAPDAVVESPDEVRAEVLKRLHASVGGQ